MTLQIKLYIKRLLETYIVGTRWNEYRWATMHKHGLEKWIKEYWGSRIHPHRSLLLERVNRFSPQSILEVGSHCGPNLYLLAKKYPQAKLVGIDINIEAVEAGNRLFREESITNVKLMTKKADQLGDFKDDSFDLVLTDAVLIYVGPDKIISVMKNLVRIARKGLILIEWQTEPGEKDPKGLGIYYGSRWKRNYTNLLTQWVPEDNIHLIKLSQKEWADHNWSTSGYLIEVTK